MTTTPLPAFATKLRELAERASPAPWGLYGKANQHVCTEADMSEFRVYKLDHQADASFIATSRAGVPLLIEALEIAMDSLNIVDCHPDWMVEDYPSECGYSVRAARAAFEKIQKLGETDAP